MLCFILILIFSYAYYLIRAEEDKQRVLDEAREAHKSKMPKKSNLIPYSLINENKNPSDPYFRDPELFKQAKILIDLYIGRNAVKCMEIKHIFDNADSMAMEKLIMESISLSNQDIFITPVQLTYVDYYYDNSALQRLLNIYNHRKKSSRQIGIDYERYIGYLFEKQGWQVIYNGAIRIGDGGIDLICSKGNTNYVVQCKCWKKKVSDREIDEFYNAIVTFSKNNPKYNFVKGIFCSTSGYSQSAFEAAESYDIKCKIVTFNSDCDYPFVKCIRFNEQAIYFLPFDAEFDKVKMNFANGDCYKFSALEAARFGYRYNRSSPKKAKLNIENPYVRITQTKLKTDNLSSNEEIYWQGNKNYPYTYFHSGYWEYVELKSCKIIYRNAVECSFSVKFIGTIENVPPKIIKTGEIMFRQRKSNGNLPEFYDDEKKVWITLPKRRKMLQKECLAEYINAILPFR